MKGIEREIKERSPQVQQWFDKQAAEMRLRAHRRKWAPVVLQHCGIPFVSKNNGAHLLVGVTENGAARDYFHSLDYWPGTGRWMTRKSDKPSKGMGIRAMLKFVTEFCVFGEGNDVHALIAEHTPADDDFGYVDKGAQE